MDIRKQFIVDGKGKIQKKSNKIIWKIN